MRQAIVYSSRLMLVVLAALTVFSCGKDNTVDPPPGNERLLEVSPGEQRFGWHGSSYGFYVECDSLWTVSGGQEWCVAEAGSGDGTRELRIQVAQNPSYREREAVFTFKSGTLEKTVKIIQNQKPDPYLDAKTDEITFNRAGGTYDLYVYSNTEWGAEPSDSWLRAEKGMIGDIDEILVIEVDPMPSGESGRNGEITLSAGSLTFVVSVVQTGDGEVFVEFEDDIFKAFCLENFDRNEDGKLSTFEAAQILELDIKSLGITSLAGIEHFSALTQILCFDNKLSAIDVSANLQLVELACANNLLTSLDISANANLRELRVNNNSLTSLVLPEGNILERIYCETNGLESLDVSRVAGLVSLSCGANLLTTIDVTANAVLNNLNCDYNLLTAIDVSRNPELLTLTCSENKISELDISSNPKLRVLNFRDNPITDIDLSLNPALTNLTCSNTPMVEIDVSNNKNITFFYCPESDFLRTVWVWEGFDPDRMTGFILPAGAEFGYR